MDLRERLCEIAKNGETIYYSQIAPSFGLDMKILADREKFGAMLDAVNKREHEAGRPLLSAVVVLKGAEMPSWGFFKVAEDLGLLRGRTTAAQNRKYWEDEITAVYKYWSQA